MKMCAVLIGKRGKSVNGMTCRMQQTRFGVRLDIYGALTRYVKLRVTHVPGMPGTFPPPPRVSDLDMHQGMCVTHMPWCMPGSLTSGFLWSRWRWKRSRHSRCMRNPQSYVSGKHRHIEACRHTMWKGSRKTSDWKSYVFDGLNLYL